MLGSFRKRGCKCPPERKRCTCGAKWYYRYDTLDPVSGKRKQKEIGGFATKAEAETEAKRILAELESGTYVEEKDICFADFAKQWISIYEKSGKKTSTVDIRKAKLKNILKYFNQIKIKDITKLQYQNMLNDMFEKGKSRKNGEIGYSRKTLQSVHETGSLLFKKAVELGVIGADITVAASVPKKPKTVEDLENKIEIPKYLEKDELTKFLDASRMFGNVNDYPLFFTLAYTGLRPGEVVALKWHDINFDEQLLSITKTFYRVKEKGRKYILQTPKTEKSERIVDIEEDVIDVLKKHQVAQKVYKMEKRDVYRDSEYVFTNVTRIPGQHLTQNDLSRRMKIILKHAGLSPELTPHSLRHTHTSLLAEAGVSLEEIMERLGHEDAKVTKRIYLHVTKSRKKKAALLFSTFMQSH